MYKTSKGFTLIELVVVIVILGILAATAAPRFIDLTSDAETASIEGVAGAMRTAVSLVNSRSIIKGNTEEISNNAALATVNIGDGLGPSNDGELIIQLGNPRAVVADWQRLLEVGDINSGNYRFATANVPGAGAVFFVYLASRPSAPTNLTDDCYAYYLPRLSIREPSVVVRPCV